MTHADPPTENSLLSLLCGLSVLSACHSPDQEVGTGAVDSDLQGFWPDGIYTAPCDEGLRYDIEAAKSMGLNMLRKHIKVEPDRSASSCSRHSLCNYGLRYSITQH